MNKIVIKHHKRGGRKTTTGVFTGRDTRDADNWVNDQLSGLNNNEEEYNETVRKPFSTTTQQSFSNIPERTKQQMRNKLRRYHRMLKKEVESSECMIKCISNITIPYGNDMHITHDIRNIKQQLDTQISTAETLLSNLDNMCEDTKRISTTWDWSNYFSVNVMTNCHNLVTSSVANQQQIKLNALNELFDYIER